MNLGDLRPDVDALSPTLRGALLYFSGYNKVFFQNKYQKQLIELGYLDEKGILTDKGKRMIQAISEKRQHHSKNSSGPDVVPDWVPDGS